MVTNTTPNHEAVPTRILGPARILGTHWVTGRPAYYRKNQLFSFQWPSSVKVVPKSDCWWSVFLHTSSDGVYIN